MATVTTLEAIERMKGVRRAVRIEGAKLEFGYAPLREETLCGRTGFVIIGSEIRFKTEDSDDDLYDCYRDGDEHEVIAWASIELDGVSYHVVAETNSLAREALDEIQRQHAA